MTSQFRPVDRRGFLRLGLGAAAVVSAGGTLAACASSGGPSSAGSGTGSSTDPKNPFGVQKGSTVDAVIFDGGYGTSYVTLAGTILREDLGATLKLTSTTQISQQLQPRFMAGDPPDLVDNSGANTIPITSLLHQVTDLTSLVNAENLEGSPIKDTLYPGVLDPTTINGKLAALNYVMTVYGMWYSKSLFDAHGWTPPQTWEEMMSLGAKAKAKNKYLMLWGKEAANYYWTFLVDSALKEGGHSLLLKLGNLEPGCWTDPTVKAVFGAMKKVVDAGYLKPGGAGTQFTQAQAQWSLSQDALLYPTGSWIENEMKSQTAKNFQMTGAPAPALTSSPALGLTAVRGVSGEGYIVPAQAKNAGGGKEMLRIMLSKQAASNFAKTTLALPIVKGVVPADGYGSTALRSQTAMLAAAGQQGLMNYTFTDLYGIGTPANVAFNSFLSGQLSVSGILSQLQSQTDKVRNDPSVTKVKVS